MEWGHTSNVTLLFRKDKGVDKRDGRLLGLEVERRARTSRFSGVSQPPKVARALCVSLFIKSLELSLLLKCGC